MEIVVIPARHEVVNSPETGAVTWCSGPPFCPQCAPANPMPQGRHVFGDFQLFTQGRSFIPAI